MKIRLDYVTNSSSSSFIAYSLSDEKLKNILGYLEEESNSGQINKANGNETCKEINHILSRGFETISEARRAVSYLNDKYGLQLSNKDIVKIRTDSNYGEFTVILEELYGIDVRSYLDMVVYQDSRIIEKRIEFLSDVNICKEYLNESSALKGIKEFIATYGKGKAASQVVDAYYLVFELDGMQGEDILELLGEHALLLTD